MFEIELYFFIVFVLGEMGWFKCLFVRVDVGVFIFFGRMLDMMFVNIFFNYILKLEFEYLWRFF